MYNSISFTGAVFRGRRIAHPEAGRYRACTATRGSPGRTLGFREGSGFRRGGFSLLRQGNGRTRQPGRLRMGI